MDYLIIAAVAVALAAIGGYVYIEKHKAKMGVLATAVAAGVSKLEPVVSAAVSAGVSDVAGAVAKIETEVKTHVAAFEAAVRAGIAGK